VIQPGFFLRVPTVGFSTLDDGKYLIYEMAFLKNNRRRCSVFKIFAKFCNSVSAEALGLAII
jgi:hypothetical protein